MKKHTFILFSFLAFAACKQDNSSAQTDQEIQMEETAGEVDNASDAGPQSPDGASAPAPSSVELPEEPLPGATSTASSAPSSENPLFNFTLQPGQAGAVQIGMSIAELRERYGANKLRETTLTQEGTDTQAFEVLGERRRTDMIVEQTCTGANCKVSRITVLNPAYKTTSGYGVGSTLGDVKKAFTISNVATGEGKLVAVAQDAKMSFVLDMKSIPAERWAKLKLKDIADTTPVIEIYLY